MIDDQPHLSNEQLRALLEPYRARYNTDYDNVLLKLEGKHYFGRDDVDKVAAWKFGSWPSRLQRTQNLLATNTERDIESLTSRAFHCNDDLGALLLIRLLCGVGKALGSAILMTHDRTRYSVIDVNAVHALQALGYLRDYPRQMAQESALPSWDRYLAAVRDAAARTGWTLRDVDRSLFYAGREDNS
jgi:hypothetical protein